jgi:DNA-binding transcriptional MerR regulator
MQLEGYILEKPYSVGEVAKLLGVPNSTITYWSDTFANFLRISRTPGGARRYDDHDVAQLRYIQQLLHDEGKSVRQALHELTVVPTADPRLEAIEKKIDKLTEVMVRLNLENAAKIETLTDEVRQLRDKYFNERKLTLIQRFQRFLLGEPEPEHQDKQQLIEEKNNTI